MRTRFLLRETTFHGFHLLYFEECQRGGHSRHVPGGGAGRGKFRFARRAGCAARISGVSANNGRPSTHVLPVLALQPHSLQAKGHRRRWFRAYVRSPWTAAWADPRITTKQRPPAGAAVQLGRLSPHRHNVGHTAEVTSAPPWLHRINHAAPIPAGSLHRFEKNR